jgi:ABC-type transport system involved in multi-copper enzyme maturation permease subunit
MVLLPVIERELRTCARQPFTYYLRAISMGALLFQCLLFGMQHGFGPTLGSALFGSLHYTLFAAIWVLVPFLTADCISRERREGTLGLLFLTRLSANNIVTAKCLAHGFRAMTLWLAVVPVLTIPFLLGGVTWLETLISIAINLCSICWALSAGLIASVWNKSWLRSMLCAVLLSGCFSKIFGTVVDEMMLKGTALVNSGPFQSGSFFFARGGYLRLLSYSIGQVLLSTILLVNISVVVFLVAIAIAGHKTRRVWQETPPSKVQVWWEKTFCTPRFWLSFFRRWMLRQIERNPIGWLERRRWSGRLVTWAWFAVVISIYSAALGDRTFFRGLDNLQNAIAWLLAGSIAVSAAGSFRRERETGLLELLLISPLNEVQIMSGRLRGLWAKFLPAFATLVALWIYFANLLDERASDGILFHLSTFLALPMVGLFFSLRCRNFLVAFLLTLITGLLLPIVLAACLNHDPFSFRFEMQLSVLAACLQIVIAYFFGVALYHRLKKRAFRFAY